MKKKYTFHEDFSGGGMARIGLGPQWDCLRACDIDSKKCAAYRENFGGEHLFEGDISHVDYKTAKKANLAWASFPCQDTSLAGGYAGLHGIRSGTFWKWWKIVEEMKRAGKPYDLLCIENVRGLLTSNNGSDFSSICGALAKAGYYFGAVVVNCIHFLPQSRERLFIIAVRKKPTGFKILKKSPSTLWHPQSMLNSYAELPADVKKQWLWISPPRPRAQPKSLLKIIDHNCDEPLWSTSKDTTRLISMMSKENKRKLLEQSSRRGIAIGMLYKRIRNGHQMAEVRFDGVAGCLRTAKGGSSRQTVLVINKGKMKSRLLTTREAANLMGLPKRYKLPKSYNDAYNLCGDGVAVPVVRFLSKTVFMPFLDIFGSR